MADLGRLLLWLGLIVAGLGLLLVLAGRLNLPVGRLPGDFIYRGKNTTIYVPLVTSMVLSVLLSVAVWVIGKLKQ